jgi:hypothetical protein
LQQGVAEASLLSAIRNSISSLMAANVEREPTIFFSYARTDIDVVRPVADSLRKAGIRVWLDEDSLKPGSDWMQEIEKGLAAADFIAFFISPSSVRGWAQQELQVALHRQVSGEGGAVILPILLGDADVPPLLRQFQWLDLRDGDIAKGVQRLVGVIYHHQYARTSPIPLYDN